VLRGGFATRSMSTGDENYILYRHFPFPFFSKTIATRVLVRSLVPRTPKRRADFFNTHVSYQQAKFQFPLTLSCYLFASFSNVLHSLFSRRAS
jgi:hypothetical protein